MGMISPCQSTFYVKLPAFLLPPCPIGLHTNLKRQKQKKHKQTNKQKKNVPAIAGCFSTTPAAAQHSLYDIVDLILFFAEGVFV